MSDPMVVAVCVTADRSKLLAQALRCFESQTYHNKRMLTYPGVGAPIGELRNRAVEMCIDADIICHWDDDEWSHENRIAEQVALLRSSGAEVVGYDRMLFWREATNEAWIYTGSILGTSLCFWRSTWERTPFRSGGHHSEDLGFVLDVKEKGGEVRAVDSIPLVELEPRMIGRIHSGNAHNPSYNPQTMETHPHNWQRAQCWDAYCQETLEAAKCV